MECINSKIKDTIERIKYKYCSINRILYYKYTTLQFTTAIVNAFSIENLYFSSIEYTDSIRIIIVEKLYE